MGALNAWAASAKRSANTNRVARVEVPRCGISVEGEEEAKGCGANFNERDKKKARKDLLH